MTRSDYIAARLDELQATREDSMTTQPTHHGYAVNVKDHGHYDPFPPLSGEDVQALYDLRAEDFWELAQGVAQDHGFTGVYSAGRSGGWAQPYPQPHTDDMWPSDVDAWVRGTFRPFEADILTLADACREQFREDVAAAQDSALREPAEAAHWAARDTITI